MVTRKDLLPEIIEERMLAGEAVRVAAAAGGGIAAPRRGVAAPSRRARRCTHKENRRPPTTTLQVPHSCDLVRSDLGTECAAGSRN